MVCSRSEPLPAGRQVVAGQRPQRAPRIATARTWSCPVAVLARRQCRRRPAAAGLGANAAAGTPPHAPPQPSSQASCQGCRRAVPAAPAPAPAPADAPAAELSSACCLTARCPGSRELWSLAAGAGHARPPPKLPRWWLPSRQLAPHLRSPGSDWGAETRHTYVNRHAGHAGQDGMSKISGVRCPQLLDQVHQAPPPLPTPAQTGT